MGKISPISAKYIIHATISIEGVVERPDVIGAIFGQTEGLLGTELELRELQRSGRIGRIEVSYDTKGGKTTGIIQIPSSLDMAETAIVAAALEVIQRIGPCEAKITVDKIEDVRIIKRKQILERAKELLQAWMKTTMPDSQELAQEVAESIKMMEVQEYGKSRSPAGPAIADSEEIIVVEGRADVLNLLKHGIKNVIGINGTNIPEDVAELCRQKTVTLFVDGDRGGDIITKAMMAVTDIDYVAKAPDGKEVEELTQKEILKALRGRVAVEQIKLESENGHQEYQQHQRQEQRKEFYQQHHDQQVRRIQNGRTPEREQKRPEPRQELRERPQQGSRRDFEKPTQEQIEVFKKVSEELIGTRGACIFDERLNILGKVPVAELYGTLKNINSGVESIVLDGPIDKELIRLADNANVKILVGSSVLARPSDVKVRVLSVQEL
ncbi:MAG: DNA primase DnaG [Candidatus Woesearchaeota archaeon]